MTQELRSSFHDSLDQVRTEILAEAALVTDTIPQVTEILLELDLDGAQKMIDAYEDTKALSRQIEEHCYTMIALQQPMASDLREIIAALQSVTHIERSAGLVANIAKSTRRMYGDATFSPKLRGIITQMGDESTRLFRLAMDAYYERNSGLAAALDDIDDRLDELQYDCVEEVFENHAAKNLTLLSAVELALIARFYERLGDHAVSVGDRVRYMVEGAVMTGGRADDAAEGSEDSSENDQGSEETG